MDILHRLGFMVVHRPYVFLPLGLFFVFASMDLGVVRMLFWFGIAYGIAFLSEWSSINTGFPYGWYYYIAQPETASEIWILGVPFWDSVSYVFLSYWSFGAACVITREPLISQESARAFPLKTWILGATLMTLADVVIDPVALQGGKWFLGTVYDYPDRGAYFGVTVANFVGWFLVALAVMGTYILSERGLSHLALRFKKLAPPLQAKGPGRMSALLYVSIVAFNILIALYIKDYLLFLCDCLIFLPIFSLLIARANELKPLPLPRLRPLRIR